jgi:hypothetical protein
MKGSMAVMAAVLALAACDGAPLATSAGEVMLETDGDGRIMVTGSGHITATGADTDWRTFTFHARVRLDGSTDGSFQVQTRQTDPENTLLGEILCVAVVGNQAWMVGMVTTSDSPTAAPGTFTRFRVVDNGEGTEGPPDQVSLMEVGLLTPPPYCINRPAAPALFDVEAGNVQIH